MKAYWLRILGAFLLLKLASGLMKDAENILSAANEAKGVELTNG